MWISYADDPVKLFPSARSPFVGAQKGFTITRMTMPIISSVGTSFMYR